jgi:hypothetical protein
MLGGVNRQHYYKSLGVMAMTELLDPAAVPEARDWVPSHWPYGSRRALLRGTYRG